MEGSAQDMMTGPRIRGGLRLTTPERSNPMGDKKGKKEKAKGQKQHEAKKDKAQKQKQDRQKPPTP